MGERLAISYIGILLFFALITGFATWYRYIYLEDFAYVLPEPEEATLEDEAL